MVRKHEAMPPFDGTQSGKDWEAFYERQQSSKGRAKKSRNIEERVVLTSGEVPNSKVKPKKKVKRK